MRTETIARKVQALEEFWYSTASVHRAREIEVRTTGKTQDPSSWQSDDHIFDLSTYGIDCSSFERRVDLLNCQIRSLFHHLRYTTCLEQILVMPAMQDIAMGRIPELKNDTLSRFAFKLITDEAFHSQYTEDLSELVAVNFQTANPFSLNEMQATVSEIIITAGLKVNECMSLELTRFCCAYVTETSITSVLRKNSEFVKVPVIKGYFKDHLQDESVHSHFFKECMARIWSHLSADKRVKVSMIVHEAMNLFLSVNTSNVLEPRFDDVGSPSGIKTLDFKSILELNRKDTIEHFQALPMS